jgi:hypothetical protein
LRRSDSPSARGRERSRKDTLDAKIAAAGKDVAKLLELLRPSSGGPQQDSADKVYKEVIEIDPNNETARKALRHQQYDGKWFESFAELAKYKRDEAAKMKAKGLARFKDGWVPEADVPYLKMGWTKDAQGAWSDPLAAERAKEGRGSAGGRVRVPRRRQQLGRP